MKRWRPLNGRRQVDVRASGGTLLLTERIVLGAISTDEEIKEMASLGRLINVAQIIQDNLTGE